MNPPDLSRARGLTARADLLRLLASTPLQALLLDDDAEQQVGYWRKDASGGRDKPGKVMYDRPEPRPAQQASGFKLPLQMPFVHVVADRQTRDPLQQAENPVQTRAVCDPITEQDARPPAPERLVTYQDLVPKARLLPALKRYVTGNRTAGLDIASLVRQIAGQRLPRRLPYRRLRVWHSNWVVVLDFCKRLWPYRQDMHRLAEHLLHACGRSGVSIRIINHGPLQRWTDWVEEQQTGGALPAKHDWNMPPADTPVLLVSDLGLLEGSDSASHRAWQEFIRQLNKAQTRPLALLPLGAEQLDAGLPKNLTLLRWSPDARIRPVRALGKGQAIPEGIKDLLAMAAVTRRVDPPLLRAMRRLNPKAPLNAGLEGAFWCHADVEAGAAANIRREAQADHLEHFGQQADGRQIELEQLRYRHHAHLRAVLNHEETLLWAAHARPDCMETITEIGQRLAKADVFMRQLAATLKQADGFNRPVSGGAWRRTLCSAPTSRWVNATAIFSRRWWPRLPMRAATGGSFLIGSTRPVWQALRTQRIHAGWCADPLARGIVLQNTPPATSQGALTGPLPVDRGGLRVASTGSNRLLTLHQLPYRLCGFHEQALIKLTTSREIMTLASVNRPRGAVVWGCDRSDSTLRVRSASLCGRSFAWRAPTDPSMTDSSLETVLADDGQVQLRQISLARRAGLYDGAKGEIIYQDGKKSESGVTFKLDEYGVRADVAISTRHGNAGQTFRWIEPGTFRMGSPKDEQDRDRNEGPQHEVTISQGFWLADTACSQALWQAVMGDNPSYFKDELNLPVEQVSWDDVQQFLYKLEKILPGCKPDLPCEAEWEYACRAGTITPFSFGQNITTGQVNYHGKYPYAGGDKGEYRGNTVAVKSLPANAWGLYQMHGNVWEWCRDGMRTYDKQAQADPLGPVTGDGSRCVRGGCWILNAGLARSARRGAFRPGSAGSDLGFRFCLRSIESGSGDRKPGGIAGPGPA